MVIFLTGATGLLGSRIAGALVAQGHAVRCAARHAPGGEGAVRGCRFVALDLSDELDPASVMPLLEGVDVVINAAGIFEDRTGHDFSRIHTRSPIALFQAAVMAGVGRIVQISALGADGGAQTPYHRSKKAADDALRALPMSSLIVQPSLVFAEDGRSTQFFAAWSTLPVVPLPGSGAQVVQPVHVDDVVDLVTRGALTRASAAPASETVAAVGPRPVTMKEYLRLLNRLCSAGAPLFMPVPMPLVKTAAALCARLPGALMSPDALAMLERGNAASADGMQRWLGRPPRSLGDEPSKRATLGLRAKLAWLAPLLAGAIGAVWIWTAIVSAWLYPRAASLDLLARVGAPEGTRLFLLYSAALLDLLLGVLCFAWPARLGPRRRLWWAQIGLIVVYSVLITWRLPEFWLHPYGPLSKNLPMIAALLLLVNIDGKGST
ncbi:SDR family oxidoreductase [Caballeronia sp. AZ7_KS35]|uniref:SDR family oxidoreductase n=1 Tax=Caballeronia sp. AZ7_KS35 TaxID=2921762 RepID=UPI0020298A36|nr:SDR family oxidoreductase [Caballeronia sp. AZ7_KS35]